MGPVESVHIQKYAADEANVIRHLRPALPRPLPVYRCMQFQPVSKTATVLTTFDASMAVAPKCFAISYVDRARRPDTEMWIYLSAEEPGRCKLTTIGKSCPMCKANIYAVLNEVKRLPVPELAYDNTEFDLNFRKQYEKDGPESSIIIVGSVEAIAANIINDAKFFGRGYRGIENPHTKYILDTNAVRIDDDLPAGYRWGKIREQDFSLVRSRTQFIRKDASLRVMPSLAIFPVNDAGETGSDVSPIAWAVLKLDGSNSVHVEQEHRGRGLAKLMTPKLFRDELPKGFRHMERNGELYGHADVNIQNAPSHALYRSIGAKDLSTIYWLFVDLSKVE